MADGQGTHATQNRLTMYAAVETALDDSDIAADDAGLAVRRSLFLTSLREQDHVVGHVTDRHHELQARCAQLLAALERRLTDPHPHTLPAEFIDGYRDAIRDVLSHPDAVAIRDIVTHPMRTVDVTNLGHTDPQHLPTPPAPAPPPPTPPQPGVPTMQLLDPDGTNYLRPIPCGNPDCPCHTPPPHD